jgi:hypothetical protein
MSTTWRMAGVLFVFAIASAAGCDKSSTTPPGKPADETYAKKLIGVWEGTEEFGGKTGPFTIDFKADNSVNISGVMQLVGTWKVLKEEGKTVTLEWDIYPPDLPDAKGKKKTFSMEFQDPNTIAMSKLEGKPDTRTLKRKS